MALKKLNKDALLDCIGNYPCINLLTQQLATVLNIPVAYLYCDGDDLVEIRLQICSASDERIREIKLAVN
jgi:hypothetical protein